MEIDKFILLLNRNFGTNWVDQSFGPPDSKRRERWVDRWELAIEGLTHNEIHGGIDAACSASMVPPAPERFVELAKERALQNDRQAVRTSVFSKLHYKYPPRHPIAKRFLEIHSTETLMKLGREDVIGLIDAFYDGQRNVEQKQKTGNEG